MKTGKMIQSAGISNNGPFLSGRFGYYNRIRAGFIF
jgi:hypothetical protein